MLGGADNPNGELLSYIIGADNAKPRACSDRSGRAASVAPWPALPASRQKDAGM